MYGAAAWDEWEWDGSRSGAWTVMGRLAARQRQLREDATAARRRERDRSRSSQMMTAASDMQAYQDSIAAAWRGGPSVLAFLFAQPDSHAIRSLDARGDYLNIRTGRTWDLFFPGYYQSDKPKLEKEIRSRCIGRNFAEDWYFDAFSFDTLRRHVEHESRDLWRYSGETDLVLINLWLPEHGLPIIDWESTISGSLSESERGESLSLSQVVEKISRDLESGLEDPSYGVEQVVNPSRKQDESTAKKVMIGALGGIVAAFAKSKLGL